MRVTSTGRRPHFGAKRGRWRWSPGCAARMRLGPARATLPVLDALAL